MNFSDLQEKLFTATGYTDTGADRPDGLVQQYKDAINTCQDEICAIGSPSLQFMTRETTLTGVVGTSDYLIDDWCQRPVSMWTEGVFANFIRFRRPKQADRDGSRNSNLVPYPFGPFQVALLPRTTSAFLSGAVGTTGASVTEGTSTVVIGASAPVIASAAVAGKMLRLNGEAEDYKILSTDNVRTITVDRAVRSRMRGDTTVGYGVGYSTVRWEIGPVGRFKLRFLPAPSAALTAYVRFMAYPREMIEADDTPELQADMHHLLWKGALRAIGAVKQNDTMYQTYSQEYADAIAQLKMSDIDDVSSDDGPMVERLGDEMPMGWTPGLYVRGVGTFGDYY